MSLKSVLQRFIDIDGKEKLSSVGLNFVLLTFLKKKMILYQIIKVIHQLKIIITVLLGVGLGSLLGKEIPEAREAMPLIAITQITSHETLDRIYQGVIDGLKEKGYTDGRGARILFANAHGDIGITVQIAQKFVAEKPAVIIAIATPSAQAVAKAISGTDLQLVFCAVTNPKAAGLVTDYQHPGGNITGTLSSAPIAEQMDMIHEIMPELKNLGIVINFGEQNSVDLLNQVVSVAKEYGIKVLPAEANNSAGVAAATRSLISKVEAFILVQDNTVASALPSLLQIANDNHVPTFAVFTEAVQQGTMMEVAYDSYDIGVQTGYIAACVLEGVPAGSMEVVDPHKLVIKINKRVVDNLDMSLPAGLMKYVQ